VLVSPHRQPNPPRQRSRATQEECYDKHGVQGSHLLLSALAFVLRRRYGKEEVTGSLGPDDITALGGVLELCFIPDAKSPSHLEMHYRSRLDDLPARTCTPLVPMKRKHCKCENKYSRGRARASCTSCKSSASGWHTISFPIFQASMLSKFGFPSRYSRLVVIALCLVSAGLQQVMSLEHGDLSRVSMRKAVAIRMVMYKYTVILRQRAGSQWKPKMLCFQKSWSNSFSRTGFAYSLFCSALPCKLELVTKSKI
jgi:hypothetical protein